MVKDAFHPSPIHDPLVTQDLASLQEDASRRRPGSLIAFLAEHEVTQLIYGARLFVYRLQTKASHLPAVVTFNSCSSPRWDTLSWWSVLRQKLSQAFFFPIPAKTLVESQPVIAWNPGRDLQSFSPKAWAMSCTGIIRCRSFNPVRNHNSGLPKLLKWLTLRIRTSVSGYWITSRTRDAISSWCQPLHDMIGVPGPLCTDLLSQSPLSRCLWSQPRSQAPSVGEASVHRVCRAQPTGNRTG